MFIRSFSRFLLLICLFFSAGTSYLLAQDFSFTATPRTGCSPQIVRFNFINDAGRDLSNATFSWSFGNGNSSSLQNPVDSYTVPGVYDVTLEVDYFGDGNDVQTLTYTDYIEIFANPTPDIAVDGLTGCIPSTVTFDASGSTPNTGPGGSNTYNWVIGGVGSFGDVVVTEVLNNTTTVDLTVQNNEGCVATISQTFQLSDPVSPDFSAAPLTTCQNTLGVNFTDATTGITIPANYTYTWDFGDGTAPLSGSATDITVTDPTHVYNDYGTYSVQLVVTNNNSGCSDTIVQDQYISLVEFTPDITANPASGCAPLDINFSNTSFNSVDNSLYSDGNQTYLWDFGDGNTSTDPNPSHTYANNGQTYVVTLTITDMSGNACGGAVSTTVTTTASPEPAISADQQDFCGQNNTVNFSSAASTNIPPPVTYLWDFGDGNTSTAANPSHTYANYGTYDVTLTVTNGDGCSASVTETSYITLTEPVADFSAVAQNACTTPFTAELTDNSTSTIPFTNWQWAVINSSGVTVTTSNDQNPDFTLNSSGTYDVQLIVSNAECSDTLRRDDFLTVGTFTPQFTVTNGSGCAPLTTTFENTSFSSQTNPLIEPTQTVSWDFGDGSGVLSGTATDPGILNPSHVFGTPGNTFVVTMTVTDPTTGCVGSTSQTVTTLEAPIPDFEVDINGDPFCDPNTPFEVNFTNTSTNLTPTTSYFWSFGDGNGSTDENPSHVYPAQGSYEVTLTVTSGNGCVESVTQTVGLTLEDIQLTLNAPLNGCAPIDGTFTAVYNEALLGTIPEFTWTVFDGTGAAVSTTVSASPTFDYNFSLPDNYTVQVAASATGLCQEEFLIAAVPVQVGQAAFNLGIGVTPTQVCRGTTISFSNTSTIAIPGYNLPTTFLWDVNEDGIFTNVGTYDPSASPSVYVPSDYDLNEVVNSPSPTVFDVTLITFSNGCFDTLTQENAIEQFPPTADFTTQIDACLTPDQISITNNTVGYDELTWVYTVNGTSSTINNVFEPTLSFTPAEAGASVTIELTATNLTAGCTDTFIRQVTLPPALPDILFTSSSASGCAPLTVDFDASISSAVSYTWTFEGHGTSNDEDPTVTFSNVGDFDVSLTAENAAGCQQTATFSDYISTYGVTAAYTLSPGRCAPATITFTDNSVTNATIDSLIWDFGNGVSQTFTAPIPGSTVFTYDTAINPQPTAYQTSLTVIDEFGCRDQVQVPLTIYDPRPDFTIDTTLVCNGSQYTFTAVNNDTSGVGLSYNWTVTGDNAQTFGNFQSFPAVFAPGSDQILLEVIDQNGCTASISKTITTPAAPQPVASFIASSAGLQCPPVTVSFTSTTTLGRAPIVQWTWDFGDGNPLIFASDTAFEFTYSQLGTYDVELTVTDSLGCQSTVLVDDLIEIVGPFDTFTIDDTEGYEPLDVIISAASTNTSYCYQVTFGDGVLDDYCPPPAGSGSPTSDQIRDFAHTYFTQGATPTTYTPVVTIIDRNATPSCAIAYPVSSVLVLPCPTLDIQDAAICTSSGASYTISATNTTHEGEPIEYAWYDNSSGSFQLRSETTSSITVDTLQFGTRDTVSVVAQIYILDDGELKCFQRDTARIYFDNPPSTSLSETYTFCTPDGAQVFDAYQADHAPTVSYEWFEYQEDGMTLVQGPVTGSSITANHFSSDPAVPITHVFTLTMSDAPSGCEVLDTIRVTFADDPVADLGDDQVLCDDDGDVTLNAENMANPLGELNYTWFVDNVAQSVSTSTFTLTSRSVSNTTTTYEVGVLIQNNLTGCQEYDMVRISYSPNPAPVLPDTLLTCGSNPTVLDAADPSHSATAVTYAWFLDGNPIVAASSSTAQINTGALTTTPPDTTYYQYVVVMEDTRTGCTTNDTVYVGVTPGPIVTMPAPETRCDSDGDTEILAEVANYSAGMTFAWYLDGNLQADTDSLFLVDQRAVGNAITEYEYVIAVTDADGCTVFDTTFITFLPEPVADIPTDFQFNCGAVSVDFDASHPDNIATDTYEWTGHFGTLSGSAVTVPPPSPLSNNVTLTVTLTVTDVDGCFAEDQTQLSYGVIPTVAPPASLRDCVGNTLTVDADPADVNLPSVTFNWLLNGVSVQNTASDTYDLSFSGSDTTLEVIATDTATGCSTSGTTLLEPLPLPIADIPSDFEFNCGAVTVELDASDPENIATDTYEWTGHFGTLSGSAVSIPPPSPLSNNVTLTVNLTVTDVDGCFAEDQIDLGYGVIPTATPPAELDGCEGENFTLDADPSDVNLNSVTFEWVLDGNSVQNTNSDSYSFTMDLSMNTLEVIATDTETGCFTVGTTDLTPHPLPAFPDVQDVSLCDAEGDTFLDASDPAHDANITYQWYQDGNPLPGETNAILDVVGLSSENNQPTAYNFSVDIINVATGCSITDQATVTYYPSPVLNFVEGSRTFACVVDGDVVLDATHPTHWDEVGYIWWSNALLGVNVPEVAPQFTIPEATFVSGSPVADMTLYLIDSLFGCNDTVSFEVELEPNPAVMGLPEDTTICSSTGAAVLTGTVNFELNPTVTYTWLDAGGTVIGNSPTISISPSANLSAGQSEQQAVTLEIESTATGCVGSAQSTLTFFPEPAAEISVAATGVCQSDPAPTLSGLHPTHDNFTLYEWRVFDPTGTQITSFTTPEITAEIPLFTGASATYSYVLETRRFGLGSCRNADTVRLTFFAAPQVSLGNDTTLCVGEGITLNAGTSPIATNFIWSLDGTPIAGATNPTLSVSETGVYSVEVTGSSSACVARDEVEIRFAPLPEFDIVGHDPTNGICAESDTLEIDGLDLANFQIVWADSLGTTVSDSAAFIVSASGHYTATAIHTTTGCAAIDTQRVALNLIPFVELRGDSAICSSEGEVLLTATHPTHEEGATYVWTENGEVLTDQTSDSLRVITLGTNVYGLTVTNPNGCTGSDAFSVTISQAASVSISGGGSPTCDRSVLLEARGDTDNVLLSWTNAAGDTLATTLTFEASIAGTYTLTALDTATGCASSATQAVLFNPQVVVALPDSLVRCENDSLTLEAADPTHLPESTNYTWTWLSEAGNVILGTGASSSLVLSQPDFGNYAANRLEVEVLNTLTGCTARDTLLVRFDPQPVLPPLDSAEICLGDTLLLRAEGATGASFAWYAADAPEDTLSTELNLRLIPEQTRTYVFALTSGNACAAASTQTVVRVNPLPEISIRQEPDSESVCVGDSIRLIATGGDSYLWSDGATQSTIVVVPEQNETTYRLSVSTAAGCQAVDSILVRAVGQEMVNDTLVACDGDVIEIGQPSVYEEATYSWSDILQTEPVRRVSAPGTYVLTTTVGTCRSTQTYVADFRPIPKDSVLQDRYNFCFDQTAFPDTSYALTAQVSNGVPADTYFFEWTNANGGLESQEATFMPQRGGTYYLDIRSEAGCEQRDTVVITANCPPRVYVPDAFTPNGDGKNEYFKLFGAHLRNVRLAIYNRWGEVIYLLEKETLEAVQDDEWWNGLHRNFGDAYPPGVYQWTLEYGTQAAPLNTQRMTGRVTLIR